MRLFLLLFFGTIAAFPQSQPAILHQTFEKDAQGWTVMGSDASIAASHDASDLRSASGVLKFRYQLGGRQFAAAVVPVSSGLASLRQIRFWAKSDHDTAVAILLSEKKPGGDYTAWFWAPANRWQQVTLTPSDFALSDGPTDPADPDRKLDLDQVQGIGIIDLASFFNQIPESDVPLVVQRTTGTHILLLDDFSLLSNPPQTSSATANAVTIDAFDRSFLEWATLGGMDLKLAPASNPLGRPAVQASYDQSDGRLTVLTRRISSLDLSKAKRLTFDVASQQEIVLAISLELKKPGSTQGPRYSMTIFPPGGRKLFHVDVSLADFEYDTNSPADDAAFDASRMKSLTFADVSGLGGAATGPNTIWLSNLVARTD